MQNILVLALGGTIGTLLRYGAGSLLNALSPHPFPLGTLAVNLIGSFVIGILWSGLDVVNLSPNIRNFLFIGLLGSFTTFSSYSLDLLNLIRENETKTAIIYFVLSNAGGFLLVWLGYLAGKQF